MIKQIQLRGISRDPSDRSNADGGCVESLNVQLNEGELAPAPIPDDITSSIGVSSSFKVLYIHKIGNKTNYIGIVNYNLCAKIDGVENPVTITSVAADPEGITSIGNILVWTTSSGTHYAVFKDGTYSYLGDSVPEPAVTFYSNAGSYTPATLSQMDAFVMLSTLGLSGVSPSVLWNTILSKKEDKTSTAYDYANQVYDLIMDRTWSGVNDARTQMRGNNTFAAPVLARYALRLYDGNYIYVSAPVLLAGTVDHDHMRVLMNYDSTGNIVQWKLYMPNTFTASVRVDFGSAGLWGDLVEAVDIFISEDIYVPHMNSKIQNAYDNGTKIVGNQTYYDAGFEMEGVSDYAWLNTNTTKNRFKEDFETEMTNKGNFYRIASIPAFTQAYWMEDLKPKAQDDLVVLPRLSEGEAHQISALGGLASYNHRLILSGEKITLSLGNRRPDAMVSSGTYTNHAYVTAFFYVRTSDGSTKIVRGYSDLDISDTERARAYITYPDPSCYKAVYYIEGTNNYTKVEIPMKEHPRLNTSYGFWGLGYRLDELYSSGDTRSSSTVASISEVEDRVYEIYNRLFLSEMDNPFSYPLGQRVTFDEKILSALPITTPLSSGQFGQYQLYVFTKGGIWAETITDEGKIAANHPVTRDTAFEGTIGQLDQGIVFASGSGVMLISGSQVTNLSPHMTAERYPIGIGGATLSNLGDWTDLMTIASDTTSFLEFIEQARFAYDYPGKRLLVFRTDKTYAWVYKLDTSTWHKQQLPSGKSFSNALNSYPDALVTMMSSGSASVVDFTTEYGDTPSERTALVITRDLTFDAPDIRKVIKAVKIRGSFLGGGSAKYILLGSMDGKYFSQLTSLKNGSWKVYKMVFLLKLYNDDRLSWVDVDVEAKFANKLR